MLVAAAALTLSLQLAPVVDDPAASTHVPLSLLAEGPPRPTLRSWTWTAAGAYGFATFGAGLGAMYASNDRSPSPSPRKANLAMAIGASRGERENARLRPDRGRPRQPGGGSRIRSHALIVGARASDAAQCASRCAGRAGDSSTAAVVRRAVPAAPISVTSTVAAPGAARSWTRRVAGAPPAPYRSSTRARECFPRRTVTSDSTTSPGSAPVRSTSTTMSRGLRSRARSKRPPARIPRKPTRNRTLERSGRLASAPSDAGEACCAFTSPRKTSACAA